MNIQLSRNMVLKTTLSLLSLTLAACSTINPPADKTTLNRISAELKDAGARDKAAPVPEAISASLLPPLRLPMPRVSARELEQRFDVVVSDALLSQVLAVVVSGTPYSIMLKPKADNATAGGRAATPLAGANLPERVSMNLKNVTLFEALDAIREVYGYDYSVDGNRIYVQPPEMQTRLYQVNYIVGQRRGVSDMQVIGGASVGTSSSSTTSNTTSSSYSSVQASALSTIAKSNIWGEVEDTVRTALGCQIPKSTTTETNNNDNNNNKNNSSGTASRADVSFQGDTKAGDRDRGVDGCVDGRAMTINQMSGTILVRAMPRELRTIERALRTMQLNIERQVIIEAKIIDVELNAGAQQGINWAALNDNLHRMSVGADTTGFSATSPAPGGNFGGTVTSSSLGNMLGTNMVGAAAGNAFSAGLGVALQLRDFSALLNFLQTQGTVQVLSSPRISTLNNQKAVIKVGSEEPYVTNISGGSQSTTSGVVTSTPPTLQYQPFFSGISLDVTPQIDDKDNITLHVHSMVNSVVEKLKLSSPTASAAYVPFAINTINEADSVVRARDGQVVVIGGLMTESAQDSRNKVPGVGDVPVAGAFFSRGAQKTVKRELVILLKSTVVKDETAWNNDITAVQGRMQRIDNTNVYLPVN